MSVVISKFKEVLYSILPITALVLILHFTLTPIDPPLLFRFLIGVVLVVCGLTIFLIGAENGITPIGNVMGAAIAKTNQLWIVAAGGLILGFFISVAEPDLHVLAAQVDTVTGGIISQGSILIVISAGIALMLAVGLIRIVYNFPLHRLLSILYGIILILALFTSPGFLAISFDASGATTGSLTVPFMLALALGVSKLKKDSQASETDSFGLVAIASTGAIISTMVMGILFHTDTLSGELTHKAASPLILTPFLHEFPKAAGEILSALLPIVILFFLFQVLSFRLPKSAVRKISFGILFTFIGLVLFLTGVNAGFMEVGRAVGHQIASMDNKAYVVLVGMIFGVVTVLAEPAVYVLTHQIEDVTSGYVSKKVVMITLSIGVGVAVALSMVRILVPELKLWEYLLPGYCIAIGLSYVVPKLFAGIAFDAGGVAAGTMTAT
ncbi:MAG: DUF1538 domain-containing protein, partial [Oscillospiraceae bacterium]|nr:DUF1538 domain-containing protein [Oscillospiraceae bacterium]